MGVSIRRQTDNNQGSGVAPAQDIPHAGCCEEEPGRGGAATYPSGDRPTPSDGRKQHACQGAIKCGGEDAEASKGT